MVVRKMTEQEKKAWLGNGLVMPGPKRPNPPEAQSASAAPSPQPAVQDAVIAHLMKRHPGLTEAEAIRHLEANGG